MDVWPKVRERPSDSTFILESHACLSPPLVSHVQHDQFSLTRQPELSLISFLSHIHLFLPTKQENKCWQKWYVGEDRNQAGRHIFKC
jgi:hypothetical protein